MGGAAMLNRKCRNSRRRPAVQGLESAGINRQKAEDENSSREGCSEPLGPEFCAGCREAQREA